MANRSKITEDKLRRVVPHCKSYAQILEKLGLAPRGGNYATLKKKLDAFKIDTSHLTGQGWNIGLQFKPMKPKSIEKLLVKGSSYQSYKLKRRLLKEKIKEHRCERCGLTEWFWKTHCIRTSSCEWDFQ